MNDMNLNLFIDAVVQEENFLLSEYIKRNFEQYSCQSDVEFALNNWTFPLKNKNDDIYKIQNYIRQILIQYDNFIKGNRCGENYDFSDLLIKERTLINNWIVRAHEVSFKNKLSIADIIFPFDMEYILRCVVDGPVKFGTTVFLNNYTDQDYRNFYSFLNKKSNADIGNLHELITNFISGTMDFGIDLDRLRKISKVDRSTKYRSNRYRVYSSAVGLFVWDNNRTRGWSIDESFQYLRDNNLFIRKNKDDEILELCSDDCSYCGKIEDCRKSVADKYKNATFCINNKSMVSTKTSGSAIKVEHSRVIFERIKYIFSS